MSSGPWSTPRSPLTQIAIPPCAASMASRAKWGKSAVTSGLLLPRLSGWLAKLTSVASTWKGGPRRVTCMMESRGSTMRPSVSGAISSSSTSTLPSDTPKPSSSASVPSERPSESVVANLMRAGSRLAAASSMQSATDAFTKSR